MALDAVIESVLATSKDRVAQVESEGDLEVARILNEARNVPLKSNPGRRPRWDMQ